MKEPLQLPFRAYHHLREWHTATYREDLPTSSYENRQTQTYYEGMRYWFHHQPAQIHVCSYEGDGQYVDVQYEMVVGKSSIQVYLMTLVTPRVAAENFEIADDFGLKGVETGIPMEDVTDPFSRPTVIWEADQIGPDVVVDAVDAWSRQFWPDFDCEHHYRMIEDGISEEMLAGSFVDWRDFTDSATDSHCRVLLQCDPGIVPDLETWAMSNGCEAVYVSQSFLVLIDGCPRELLPQIEERFESLDFAVAPTLSAE